ncbi:MULTISPECIES: hypothetical protein [unclassified Streptosporangium]|uniref:hypothetical protein n=1 Tax=unclassified Streptosporangium TaxID=2632669 RepID=UPI002E2B2DEC|nr:MULTISPECIES: hypothetical protein [unclassified Streptosporangium]
MNSDFDFLHGSWDVVNRRLLKPLSGSDEWEEFPGTSVCHGFFGGAGIFDEIVFPTKGFSGATLRIFDTERELWGIYWVNSRFGTLQEPVFGAFADGRGVFYGDDTHEGAPIRVRYVWSQITPVSALWEQAFSTDGEETWETNWTMAHTRRA